MAGISLSKVLYLLWPSSASSAVSAFFYLLDLPAAVRMLPMRLAAVLRRAGALLHSIVAHHRGHSQPVIGEHPAAPFCLRHSMPREIAPSANRLVVAPERQGQILALCGQACEALDRYESIDLLQVGLEGSREIEIFCGTSFCRPHFKDHRDHGRLLLFVLRVRSSEVEQGLSYIQLRQLPGFGRNVDSEPAPGLVRAGREDAGAN